MVNQKRVLSEIDKISNFSVIRKNQEMLSDLEKLKNRVQDDTFRIAVVGEFSSGKSTFINAILGKDLLSHAVNETTAVITRICHVDKTDERLGFCDIVYYDGKSIRLEDTYQLKKYTTVQEGDAVADKIRSVTIYVHLPYISYPIIIVDTPGLNGIADKHREITLEEVKKSHACIYLLSDKGFKESDGGILRTLMNYQSEFIFVQNFIDTLHKTEGESYEGKIEDDIQNLEKLCGTELARNCHICGVSALKALSARDISIQKLYHADAAALTSEDRERLEEESNFRSFEEIITGIVNSGEYKQVIYRSVGHVLNGIIQQTLTELENQQLINEKLQRSDSQQNRIVLIQQKLEQMYSGKERQKKQLNNFIVSSIRERKQVLTSEMKEQLSEAETEICQEIDRIQNYEQYVSFEKSKGKISAYFGQKINSIINAGLIPELQQYIRNDAEDVYNAALQRVSKYTPGVAGKNERIEIQIDKSESGVSFRFQGKDEEIQAIKKEIGQREEQLLTHRKDLQDNQKEKQNEETMLRNQQREENRLKNQMNHYQNQVRSMGAKPDIERKTRTVKYEKTGFSAVIGFLTGDMYDYELETYYDDSAQRAWEAERKNLDEYYQPEKLQKELDTSKTKINKIYENIDDLNYRISHSKENIAYLESNISRLKDKLAGEKRFYEEAEKRFREEYCRMMKKKLKESVHDSLFEAENCAHVSLEKYISDMYDRYTGLLQKNIGNIYQRNMEAQKEQLQKAMTQTQEELRKKYHAVDDEIQQMKKTQKNISQMLGNKLS